MSRHWNRIALFTTSALVAALVMAASPGAAQSSRPGTGLTIYTQNLAVVRAHLERTLDAGQHTVRIDGLPTGLDAASLMVLNPEVVLLGTHGSRTYQSGTESGASLDVDLQVTGRVQRLDLAYLTGGLGWSASYSMIVEPGDRVARIDSYASVTNGSGTTYVEAEVQLLAGQVQVTSGGRELYRQLDQVRAMAMSEAAPSFGEGAFGGYHLYTADEPLTLRPGATRRIRLTGASGFDVIREFVLYGETMANQRLPEPAAQAVTMRYRVPRPEGTDFGATPLPAGTVRIFQPDAEGRLQLLGMSNVPNSPAGEELLLPIGRAFDVTAVRTQTDFARRQDGVRESAWSIALGNETDEDVTVQVFERVHGDWTLMSSSHAAQELSATTLRFDVEVPAGGEAELTYRVSVRN